MGTDPNPLRRIRARSAAGTKASAPQSAKPNDKKASSPPPYLHLNVNQSFPLFPLSSPSLVTFSISISLTLPTSSSPLSALSLQTPLLSLSLLNIRALSSPLGTHRLRKILLTASGLTRNFSASTGVEKAEGSVACRVRRPAIASRESLRGGFQPAGKEVFMARRCLRWVSGVSRPGASRSRVCSDSELALNLLPELAVDVSDVCEREDIGSCLGRASFASGACLGRDAEAIVRVCDGAAAKHATVLSKRLARGLNSQRRRCKDENIGGTKQERQVRSALIDRTLRCSAAHLYAISWIQFRLLLA